MKKRITAVICALLATILLGQASVAMAMRVSSQSIVDGKIITACAYGEPRNNPPGGNQSPQLTWAPVQGAGFYSILMVDNTGVGNGFVHWALSNVTDTSLAQGADASMTMNRGYNGFGKQGYGGPAAPQNTGAHKYTIYVYAHAFPVTLNLQGEYSNADKALTAFEEALGKQNIVDMGAVSGTYTYGDNTALAAPAPAPAATPADRIALDKAPADKPYANTRVISKSFKADGKTYKAGVVVELKAKSPDGKFFYFDMNDVSVKVSAKNLASGEVVKLKGLPKQQKLAVDKEFALSDKIKASGYFVDASLSFVSQNEDVAAVVERDGKFFLQGVSAGKTIVSVVPKYGKTFTFSVTVK